MWPGVFAGAAVVSTLPLLRSAETTGFLMPLSIGSLIAFAVTSEPFVAAAIYRRAKFGGALLDHARNVAALLLVAGPISCAAAATLATLTLAASGAIEWSSFSETWLTWVVGDLAGIYMLAPAVLAWAEGDRIRLNQRDRGIMPLAIAGIALVCVVSFLDGALIGSNMRLAFLPFPLVVFIAYRFNDRLASLVGSAVAAALILATAKGHGPFGDHPTNQALIELQVFTLVGILTALFTRSIANERDAAERETRRLSSDLAHLSRVTLMGELAAGMAHEYHQPLTAISNYAGASLMILRKHESARDELGEPLQRIADEAMRAAGIIDRLRAFLQKRQPQRSPCDANEIASEAVRFVQMAHSFPAVSFSCRLAPGLPLANVDDVQITQILLNLLLNSCEAIEESGRQDGLVEVSTHKNGAGRIRIRIADNGPGMGAVAARSCFDQFYSTKENGLGIGLSISRTLAHAHGGQLTLETSSPEGTTLCLDLPVRGRPNEI